MIEAIMKAISEFVQRILPNSEKALFKEKKRYVEKQNREYIKNQYRRIFAEADIDELNLINKLITNNNMPVKTLGKSLRGKYLIKALPSTSFK